MSKTTQDKSVQKTTPETIQLPHIQDDFKGDGRRFWRLADDDFMGGCKIGALYASACLDYIKQNPKTNGAMLHAFVHIGDFHAGYGAVPDKKLGATVGFCATIDGLLTAAMKENALNEGFEDSDVMAAVADGWLQHFTEQHYFMEERKAEEKKRVSERNRRAAMIRWHGKGNQAAKAVQT